ncbi:MAG: terminase gpA endonuclease subunit, partial [Candidatus Hinthialibacter sp.]
GEGDPVELAEARTRTFKRKKIFIFSTPTIKDSSRIEREFEKSDQRYYFVPCPHCGQKQRLEFRRADGSYGLRWRDESKSAAVYVCRHCGGVIEEGSKTRMLAQGEWRPTAEGDGKTAGFHISSLYSPAGLGLSWSEIMDLWDRAQGDAEKLKSFINTILGETWEERGDAPEWRRIYERREDYPIGKVPEGGLFLTAGVDVQQDRLEASVWAWGRGRESWLIEHRILEGDTSRPEAWRRLSAFASETWENHEGVLLSLARIAVDTGYAASEAYHWIRTLGDSRVMAVKGVDRWDVMLGSASAVDVNYKGKRIKRGIRVWPAGVSMIKIETYRFLRLEKPTDKELEKGGYPPGFMHFPMIDEEFFRQLTAESLVTRIRRGYAVREWRKDRERNEALDCRVYARAAAAAYGL